MKKTLIGGAIFFAAALALSIYADAQVNNPGVTLNGSASVNDCMEWAGSGQIKSAGSGACAGSSPVQSVFGRTGAIVAATNDYNFNQLAGTLALTQLGNAAANTVLSNWTGGAAQPLANVWPACANDGGHALVYANGVGLACAVIASGGTVTSVVIAPGTGIAATGTCTVTTTGTCTIALAAIANNTVLGNVSGISAAPAALSQTQLTALINPATASLPGAMGAFPGTTTTYLNGNNAYVTHNCASLTNAAASCAIDATVASNITSGTLPAARLPVPTATTLGGVESLAAVSHTWINTISTSGVPVATQPACGDLSNGAASCSTDATNAANISSGTLPAARLPAPSATTLGGVESFGAISHSWINSISTLGVPTATQPACGDLSNGAASCSTDATNAANISSGTLPAARLPVPSATTLGGVESLAVVAHKWINTISTSGVPAATQPACGDLSNAAASCSTDTTNASNISTGTLAAARGGPGTSSFVGGGTTSGYATLGGGLIFQWGSVTVGSGATVSVTFGLAFPSGAFGCQVSIFGGATVGLAAPQYNSLSTSGVGIINNFGTTQNIEYLCYGV